MCFVTWLLYEEVLSCASLHLRKTETELREVARCLTLTHTLRIAFNLPLAF